MAELWAAWVFVAIDAIVAFAILLRPRRRRPRNINTFDILLAAFAVGILAIGRVGFVVASPLNGFGWIRIAYFDCVVLVPACGALLLLLPRLPMAARWRVTRPASTIAALGLLAAPIGVHASFIERFRTKLETPTHTVSSVRMGKEPVRIGILSDIQTDEIGEHEMKAVRMLMEQSPDLILMPGDLWQGSGAGLRENLPRLHAMLRELRAPAGVFFVPGHCERGWDIRPMFEGTPVRVIDNQIVRVACRDRYITLGAVDVWYTDASMEVIRRLEKDPGDGDIRLLLAHPPDYLFHLEPRTRIDLLVAGHTHGGQVVLPGFGPLITSSRVPRDVAAGGLHEVEGKWLYVSRGVGCERNQAPRIRFNCRPEVTVLTIR